MKNLISLFLLIILLNSNPLISKDNIFKNLKQIIPEKKLEGKNIQELWLLKNSIYAQYGKPFYDYDLHCYFMNQAGYKPSKKYSDKKLTSIDKQNIDLVVKKISELQKNDFKTVNSETRINFDNVYNKFLFPAFTDDEKNKLEKNGFVTLPTDQWTLYSIYENNDYLNIPSFVSTDLVIQLYYLFFDVSMQVIEEEVLYNQLDTLCRNIQKNTYNLLKKTNNPKIQAALLNNLAYFSIPLYYLSDKKYKIPDEVNSIVKKEIEKCESHIGFDSSEILERMYNYSQHIPRGHYNKSQRLKNYFNAMMWLGNAGIDIDSAKGQLAASLINHILYTSKEKDKYLIDYWEPLNSTIAFFVGLADDPGPKQLQNLLIKEFGENAEIENYLDTSRLNKVIVQLPAEKISGHGEYGLQKKQYRMIGQSYTPDAEIFHNLTKMIVREVPNSLDIMAGFGSAKAKSLMLNELKDSWKSWDEYPSELEKVISKNNQISQLEWTKNLYYYWIWSLKSLIEIKDKKNLQFFMTTDGWERKSLNTALSSWAELKNSTILYAKQANAAECGGFEPDHEWWIPGPPKGYVEPNVEFYTRLYNLIDFTKNSLKEKGFLNVKLAHAEVDTVGMDKYEAKIANNIKGQEYDFGFDEMQNLVKFLKEISEKELKKISLSYDENFQIQKVGSLVENLTLKLLDGSGHSNDNSENEDDFRKKVPVIADVFTSQESVVEVGVGKPQEIYVIVEIEGRLKITRGAIFSFQEFLWNQSDRLTNEKWQKMIESNKNLPPIPAWTLPYRSNSQKQKELKPYFVPHEFVPSNSTNPGWNLIEYGTGC